MLRLYRKQVARSHPVLSLKDAQPYYATESTDDPAGASHPDFEAEAHVTELTASEEGAVRVLDRLARHGFTQMQFCRGAVEVAQAGAGCGKSSCIIQLAVNLTDADADAWILILTFNVNASLEGQRRTPTGKNICWMTIDSLLWQIYSDEYDQDQRTDLDDARCVQKLCRRLLGKQIDLEEAGKLGRELEDVVNRGCPHGAGALATELYHMGIRGLWFSYGVLRLRARDDPRWERALRKYGTIIIDEGQDINRVMIFLILKVRQDHMLVFARDRSQKLYAFMRCEDILDHLAPGSYRLWRFYLTFRFGGELCELVNAMGLSQCATFPARAQQQTSVRFIPDADVIPGGHVLLLSHWVTIIKLAEAYRARGRRVAIDAKKRNDLMAAAASPDWTKYNKSLFKAIDKASVLHTLEGIEGIDFEEEGAAEDVILMSTVHGFKGMQHPTVRLGRCVLNVESLSALKDWKKDTSRVYVATTRSQLNLYIADPQPCKSRPRAAKRPYRDLREVSETLAPAPRGADDGRGAADDGRGAADEGRGAADDGRDAADDGRGAVDDGRDAAAGAVVCLLRDDVAGAGEGVLRDWCDFVTDTSLL